MNGVMLRQKTPDEQSSEWLSVLTSHMGDQENADVFSMCLITILEAMHWQGNSRRIVEAMPYGMGIPSVADLRDTLVRLGFETIEVDAQPGNINERLLPCLVVDRRGIPTVMLEHTEEGYRILDGQEPQRIKIVKRPRSGNTYVVRAMKKSTPGATSTAAAWTRQTLQPFRRLIFMSLSVSFFINILALVAPITIMTIYDQVIGKESHEMLVMLMIGVGVAAVFEIGMRILRAWSQAYLGSRLDYVVGGQVFQQIMHLSPAFTERAPVGGQVTRMREFETFREVFTGPLASLVMDLPFSLVFVAAIAFIAGPLAIIPIVLAGLYVLLAMIVTPELKARNRTAGEARSKRHAFLVELMWWMRSIKQIGVDDTWRDRCRKLSADAAQANLGVAQQQSFAQNASQTLMTIAGVATLGFGVMRAMDGSMSLGALIATMILVWRVLSPIQTMFSLVHRIEQLRQSIDQLVGVLNYDREQEPGDAPTTPIRFQGRINLNRVSMRYTSDANAALLGVSLTIEPGEILGVVGDSGSGKTSLAKLILGLYRPQGGSISIDGIDIRQLRPIPLRQTISYVPQRNHAFPGSLLENIRLADPGASLERVREACRMAGLLHKVDALPQGLNTTFRDGLQSQVPAGFLRQIALARAFLRDAPIYVLDEPAQSLEDRDEQVFLNTLNELRGQATVVMITQRPSHMRLCDKLVVLNGGQIQHWGPTEQVLAEREAARKSN